MYNQNSPSAYDNHIYVCLSLCAPTQLTQSLESACTHDVPASNPTDPDWCKCVPNSWIRLREVYESRENIRNPRLRQVNVSDIKYLIFISIITKEAIKSTSYGNILTCVSCVTIVVWVGRFTWFNFNLAFQTLIVCHHEGVYAKVQAPVYKLIKLY